MNYKFSLFVYLVLKSNHICFKSFRRTKEAKVKIIERQNGAKGIDKKFKTKKKYGETAVIKMATSTLPKIAKNEAKHLSTVNKITILMKQIKSNQ